MKARIPVLFSLLVALSSTAQAAGTASTIPVRSDGSSITADVAERVGPAVVFIRSSRSRVTTPAPSGIGGCPEADLVLFSTTKTGFLLIIT